MMKSENLNKMKNRYRSIAVTALVAGLAFSSVARVHGAAMIFEAEPANDLVLTATELAPGEMARGNIDPMTDVDWWYLPGNSVGDLIFAYVDTQNSTQGNNSYLRAYDNSLLTLIEDDANDGPGNGSLIAGAVVPTNGDVFFWIEENGNNAEITPYTFFVSIVDPTMGNAETEPNDSIGTAQPYAGPFVSGQVPGVDMDVYSFFANAGDEIVAIVDDDADEDGINTDTELVLIDTDGTTLLANGDDAAGNAGNGVGAVIAPSNGTYYLRVSHGGGGNIAETNYRFVILVNGEAPDCNDGDGDGICDGADNCPAVSNPGQEDADFNGTGDACEGGGLLDTDGDGIPDAFDNCPTTANPMQQDTNADGTGDACEPTGPCGVGALPLGPMMLIGLGAAKRRSRRRRRS